MQCNKIQVVVSLSIKEDNSCRNFSFLFTLLSLEVKSTLFVLNIGEEKEFCFLVEWKKNNIVVTMADPRLKNIRIQTGVVKRQVSSVR